MIGGGVDSSMELYQSSNNFLYEETNINPDGCLNH